VPWAPTYIATKASFGTGTGAPPLRANAPPCVGRSIPLVMRVIFAALTPAATRPSRMPSVSATTRSARR
jgi:hypothetical protein